jgi:stage V sporulation protein G
MAGHGRKSLWNGSYSSQKNKEEITMPKKPIAAPQQEQTPQTAAPTQASPPIQLAVRVRPIKPMGNLLGYASVNINGAFAVDGIKVVSGKNGLFTSMPSYLDGAGKYRDVCFPVTPEFRQQLNEAVVSEYQQTLERMQNISQQGQEQSQQTPEIAAPTIG